MNKDDFVEIEAYPHEARNRYCYRIHVGWSSDSLETTAQGLLNLGTWIEQHRTQLEQQVQLDLHYKKLAQTLEVKLEDLQYPISHPGRIIHDGGDTEQEH